MENRIKMAFEGWASQFENIPTWRPEIYTKDGQIYLDECCLGDANKKIEALEIVNEGITVYWDEEGKSIVTVNWEYGKEPQMGSIDFISEE